MSDLIGVTMVMMMSHVVTVALATLKPQVTADVAPAGELMDTDNVRDIEHGYLTIIIN